MELLVFKPDCSVHPPPAPLKLIVLLICLLNMLTVWPAVVEIKLIVPPRPRFIAEANTSEPEIFIVLLQLNVGLFVTPVQSMLFTFRLATFTVTVWLPLVKEFASKNTLSSAVGGQPAAGPPLLSDQWLPSSQLPPLPIQ